MRRSPVTHGVIYKYIYSRPTYIHVPTYAPAICSCIEKRLPSTNLIYLLFNLIYSLSTNLIYALINPRTGNLRLY